MSTPRLTFLYPMFYRSTRHSASAGRRASSAAFKRRSPPTRSAFSTNSRRYQGTTPQRYGTAREPVAHLKDSKKVPLPEALASKSPSLATKEKKESAPTEGTPEKSNKDGKDVKDSQDTSNPPAARDAAEARPSTPPPDPPRVAQSKPLDTVLHMPSPAEEESQKPPHLKTPPYVHHFDTYSLVKDLERGGFSLDQSITVMKAVRGILTDNMELATDGLVSKSNVENESYLFRAACSELRTEISNNRKNENEKMRTQRNQLQHEVDILGQRMTQESASLKDDLKGMFDDRKMAVRQEQRSMEHMIQELNYKITVTLNSDARSEVEGLRWVLTRRAAIAIGTSALMILAVLRYSSWMTKQQEEERRKMKEQDKHSSNENNGSNNGGSNGGPRPSNNDDTIGDELLNSKGGVSLG